MRKYYYEVVYIPNDSLVRITDQEFYKRERVLSDNSSSTYGYDSDHNPLCDEEFESFMYTLPGDGEGSESCWNFTDDADLKAALSILKNHPNFEKNKEYSIEAREDTAGCIDDDGVQELPKDFV